ncbi:putative toxin-antitoxin system toxin component, PIN family [Oleiagrimonas citrea]
MSIDDDPRPQAPEKPLPSDCCGSGCDPCILDAYEDELEHYHLALEAWLLRHPPMSGAGTTPRPRLVLDTNVLLDLYVFRDPNWRPLLELLQSGACDAVTSPACRDEFLHVLQYPLFKLSPAQRVHAIEAFDALHRCLEVPVDEGTEALPRCRDPDDQKFLELALQSKADVLLSKDKALLKLARRLRRLDLFAVQSPKVWLEENAPA